MKLLLLLLLPVSVVCQDSSLVKWNAKKKGKSPTDISFFITADIKKGYFIHPCEDCSFNDWDDIGTKTDISYLVDSNWKVNLTFTKNKYKQKTNFRKEKEERHRQVIKEVGTTMEPYSEVIYRVDCRVYNKMKLFRGIELIPSEKAIAHYIDSLSLKENASEKDQKKRDKLVKDAPKVLAGSLQPPDHILLTINYKVNNDKEEQAVIEVPNTYKSKKVWGWKKTPRRIVNKESAPPKIEDK